MPFALNSSYKDDGVYIIYGQPGVGKTFAAVTASQYWPEDLEKISTPVVLKDLLYVQIDKGALDGLIGYGISVPTVRLVDFINRPDPKAPAGKPRTLGVVNGVAEMHKFISETLAEHPEITTRIDDTISSLDDFFADHIEQNPAFNKEGQVDTQRGYDQLGNLHRRYYFNATQLGLRNIFLFHAKANATLRDAAQIQARKVQQVAGGGSVTIDMSGQKGKGAYINNSSLMMHMQAVKEGGKWKRTLHPESLGGFEGKNRFRKFLPDTVDANMASVFEICRISKARAAEEAEGLAAAKLAAV